MKIPVAEKPSPLRGSAALRSELFSLEQLKRHARAMAKRHQIGGDYSPQQLLQRLADNERVLLRAYDLVAAAVADGARITPAAEWLLDNYYLIEQQIELAREHLPRNFDRELPRLSEGPLAGYPRVYSLAFELTSHVDGRIDAENLSVFIDGYQSIQTLKLGELWAVPIMARLVLIENIRRIGAHIVHRREQRLVAQEWANRFLEMADSQPTHLPELLASLASSSTPFGRTFVQEFFSKLQGQSPALSFVLNWVEQHVGESLTMEQLLQADSQHLAADQVSIGNSISSLRFLGAMDWREFVETMSVVERRLREDPADAYAEMDFPTRDRYRHRVEELAKRTGLSEDEVAQHVVDLAAEAQQRDGRGSRDAHVGYYLIDAGMRALQTRLGKRAFRFSLGRTWSLPVYLLCIVVLTTLGGAVLAIPVAERDGLYWTLFACAILSASQAALAVVNLFATSLAPARLLPRMDFSGGIPPEERTMVVVPALLTSPGSITRLIEGLEVRHLGNRDEHLSFALLTDFRDAAEEVQPDDAELLQLARDGIVALNEKYSAEGLKVFHLFHRPRVWNPHEKVWMGYERKRGKLEQFNKLLRGGSRDAFSVIDSDPRLLSEIKSVITLDTDTRLPRDAARKLVGNLAHPLNRPVYDAAAGRVVAGYSILQPRVSVNLPNANRSRFARLSAGDTGLDPYTREVSDVYQDVFGEASYVGKGIYDVDAFQQSVADQFPDNLILSHDLVESCFARCGFVSDVDCLEDHPASYCVEASRRHRWIRGDWQIAGWLWPWSPAKRRNRLNALSRWKIFDNLRRSLVPLAMLLWLAGGWILAPEHAVRWTIGAAALVVIPAVLGAFLELTRKQRERIWKVEAVAAVKAIRRPLMHALLTLVFTPYRTLINLDAILQSAVRMIFTRRGLLLWHTSSYAKRNARTRLIEYYREMWVGPAVAIGLIAWLSVNVPAVLLGGGPLLLLWLVSPVIGWWMSQPTAAPAIPLSREEWTFLRMVSRRTWRYFEEFVGPADNWLAPDNFQEIPAPTIASRTSPTNLGMALLANLAAHDFGYISVGQLLQRTENSLAAMEKLERFRGHFYNWYDTRTLKPLTPVYVSSVDSGNLLASLWTLRAGLLELKTRPVVEAQVLAGLRDTLNVLAGMTSGPALESLQRILARESSDVLGLLKEMERDAGKLEAEVTEEEHRWWARAFQQQCVDQREELLVFAPESGGLDRAPSLEEMAGRSHAPSAERIKVIEGLAQRCSELASMDYSFLYDSSRELLAIGFNVNDRRRDPSFYDLLASEARLASFLLIAQDQLPQEHWFALGRQWTSANGSMALISWSGSMFEYLMPGLFLPSFEGTLLESTDRAVVRRQIEYGRERNVPWGISESCYGVTDAQRTYQYRAFGVPGLGFKRGLSDDLVVAPYATMLALPVAPREACHNLQALAAGGSLGPYGFYEALDFTPTRLRPGQSKILVRTFMVHHQGMSLLSLAHLLLDRPMQRRLLSEPQVRATELLLQERMPRTVALTQPHTAEVTAARKPSTEPEAILRVFNTPQTPTPEVHMLSNGRYHLMVTNAGGGYSRWNDLTLTRWREDATRDCWGSFCYLRDLDTGSLWSTTFQPTCQPAKDYAVTFLQARVEYRRRDGEIDAQTEICVSPEDDVEIRRVTLTNLSGRTRRIEVTTFSEVVLAPLNADLAHPVFSNLFVQTEILRDREAILCTRRARSSTETPPWMLHLVTAHGDASAAASFETDRAKFLGRGGTVARPAAFSTAEGTLSNTAGSVLDPAAAVRRVLTLKPDESACVHIVTGAAQTREAAVALIDKYRDSRFVERAFEMAWSHSQIVLRQLHATEADAQLYARLATCLIHATGFYRAAPSLIARNRRGQSALWPYAVSGDLPIVLLRIGDINRLELVRQVLQAHAYWRMKGLTADLVILNEDFSGYRQSLHDQIVALIATGSEAHLVDKPGGIFVRRAEQMPAEDRIHFQAVAHIILTDTAETLAEQVERRVPVDRLPARFTPTRTAGTPVKGPAPEKRPLLFDNGLGGFTADGREYVITLQPGQATPAPWSNVIANSQIGTVVTESGSAYTWVENAHEFRLTTWHNDPVCDTTGEACYLRDEETGQVWSLTPLPARGTTEYSCRHGLGYSIFEHEEAGIRSEMTTFVAVDAPVKILVIKLRNESGRARRLSVTGFWELVLGQWRHVNLMHVVTEIDSATNALFARNTYNPEFADRVVFAHVDGATRTVTGNRAEFLGRNGSLASPAALGRVHLSGRVGAGLDPCAALQSTIEIPSGQETEVVFVFGAGRGDEEARQLVRRFGGAGAHEALERVWDYWNRTLGTVHVETPDPAVNVMANHWLLYQTLSSRVWARSGFYQSGGAYGFRDQLQDSLALLWAAPGLTRDHLLRCAAHQFREGDVQHWWHPPSGRGVRTHFSDDYLWLPYATCTYVAATNDTGVLDERVPFIEGRPVGTDEEGYFDLPARSEEAGTLYEHCVRAVRNGLRFGAHGLPLMGCGDWNDGMNGVGKHGQGESVWLAFFLYDILGGFRELALRKGDPTFAEECATQAEQLRLNIEQHGWDGQWYRRAYFDDGTPLGSATNEECQIDSIAQSWAVLSGAAPRDRARAAMDAVDRRLVRRDWKLIQLFDPPFDTSPLEPGYIKGYVPGVRENGGQYTHGAIWAAMAFAELGDVARAWELLSMINPVMHAENAEAANVYKVEPYVVAADVYAVAPHIGRGGWTWYTGSAGWMYRLIIETLLGLQRQGDRLRFDPRLPPAWPEAKIHYRHEETFYHIVVSRSDAAPGTVQVTLDGVTQEDAYIPLLNDHQEHAVEVRIPA